MNEADRAADAVANPGTYRASQLAVAVADSAPVAPADAITLLKAEHAAVRQLFATYEELLACHAPDSVRGALAAQICAALIAHTRVEEALFYPAAREALHEPQPVDEAEAEHGQVKALIASLQSMQPQEVQFTAALRELRAAVDAHVHDEEEQLFPRVQSTNLDLLGLGELMAHRNAAVLAELQQSD